MTKRVTVLMLGALALGSGWWLLAGAQGIDNLKGEDKAVAQVFEGLAKAFNKGDAKALAARWSADAVYVSQSSGERLKGRKAIEEDFAKLFAAKKLGQITIALTSIRHVTPDVASVEGSAKVVHPGELAGDSTFSALLVKMDGQWFIDSVHELDLPTPASNEEQLKPLAWLIGDWHNKTEDLEVKMNGEWSGNHNFITCRYAVAAKGEDEQQVTLIVTWDAAQKKIRSWVFDSDGTFGEGTWSQDGERWTIKASGVLPSGKRSSATQLLTKLEGNRLSWQSTNRSVDGQLLPNEDAVILARAKATKKEAAP